MARVVLVCHRDGSIRESFNREIAALEVILSPESIQAPPPEIRVANGVHMAVLSPFEDIPVSETGVALGAFHPLPENWSTPGSDISEGIGALFRADTNCLELATDIINTRTLWYFHGDDVFIASTSQRAIVYFLESFEPCEETFAWMLSSGTLGPGLSWDKRIKSMPPDSRLTLNRGLWKATLISKPPRFTPENLSMEEHAGRLEQEIEKALAAVQLDCDRWVLPLSGGYDSRLLLLLLHERHPKMRCVTWGTATARESRFNDAAVATRLCEELNVRHAYFQVDVSPAPVEEIFRRFVTLGEGRIDHISAYLDGFDLWKRMYERGIRGIVRGDECFGSRYLYSELDFRKFLLATMLSDYEEFGEMNFPRGFRQHWPRRFRPFHGETLETWRDRLYAAYYCAYCLGALNELKLGYVEIVNPLACRNIIERVRTVPDRWRNDKKLFRSIVERRSPPVPFAKYPAIDLGRRFLKSDAVKSLLLDELHSSRCASLLPKSLLAVTADKVRSNHAGGIGARYPFLTQIRPFIHPRIVKTLQKTMGLKERVDYFDVALRCYIISRATAMLSEDARALHHAEGIPNDNFNESPVLLAGSAGA